MPQTREASKTAATPEIRQASDKTMTTSETLRMLAGTSIISQNPEALTAMPRTPQTPSTEAPTHRPSKRPLEAPPGEDGMHLAKIRKVSRSKRTETTNNTPQPLAGTATPKTPQLPAVVPPKSATLQRPGAAPAETHEKPQSTKLTKKEQTLQDAIDRLKKGGMPDYAFKVILAMHKGEFCDYQIKCGQRTFKINRAIVGVQSPVLRVHLKKRKPDFYEIHDFSGDVVEKAIEFFSRRRYEAPGAPGSAGSGDSAGFHMEMYCFAQKYKVSGLGTLAIRKFSAEVRAIKDIEELVEVIISVYKRQEEVGTLKEYLLYPLQVFKPAARGCSDADRGLELLKLKCPGFFFDYVVRDLKKQWKRSRRAG